VGDVVAFEAEDVQPASGEVGGDGAADAAHAEDDGVVSVGHTGRSRRRDMYLRPGRENC
jgi:hypothetical protein